MLWKRGLRTAPEDFLSFDKNNSESPLLDLCAREPPELQSVAQAAARHHGCLDWCHRGDKDCRPDAQLSGWINLVAGL